jgi:hypothetical protein
MGLNSSVYLAPLGMNAMVNRVMNLGVVGMSTDLIEVPGFFAKSDEILASLYGMAACMSVKFATRRYRSLRRWMSAKSGRHAMKSACTPLPCDVVIFDAEKIADPSDFKGSQHNFQVFSQMFMSECFCD